jgi:hypothetical protein
MVTMEVLLEGSTLDSPESVRGECTRQHRHTSSRQYSLGEDIRDSLAKRAF